ncbi:putative TIM-barrel fold metal-dependent hydrolase [Palleronia aestuarii]|uniref:Putative TIM-barrel fold metal-dependent hydrolase n=1 Tax=Palleronia aestuarii TaxID=568105 RepID=A0A2W7NKL6_9RHOB|nr:amidohydrolase family protein [Palleronia aestuarii]PZX17204.1 putative TIM-barrel fold metal-dependent hydrolase [Palleronia aestuarii]
MPEARPAIWDAHAHVIGDPQAYPLAPNASYTPSEAPLAEYLALLDTLGAEGGTLVQPSIYGHDHRCLLDAIADAGGRLSGVAVPAPGTARADLSMLHAAGVRGVRCNLMHPGGLSIADTRPWWDWMAEQGWHLQVQFDASATDPSTLIPDLPVPVVVDHMGYPRRGPDPTALRPFLDWFAGGSACVKLSAPYRYSADPAPHTDAQSLAAALLDIAADRCLFATDWPHTEMKHPVLDDRAWRETVEVLAGKRWPEMHAAARKLYRP